ncbi:MAG: glycogen debranching enzyme, partial [Actinobacteria bacterium]|nr:glycogen debranching enzyme [Actinomycetota bacterium]
IIQQDPVISQVKLIAEPWDVGEGGYQVGNFPTLWTEWNGKYRDSVRDFWRGASAGVGELASRMAGSSDLYAHNGRRPYASINFVTAHDGFTLRDLVSYNEKHNNANLDDNSSGEDHNRSYNHGVEGPTDDLQINELRLRQQRNLLTTLFLSQGVPMLLGGDEFGRTQDGNNNVYCQDNPLAWYDWELSGEQRDLLSFTRRLIELRASHPVFRRQQFFRGHTGETVDLHWLRPDGAEMAEDDWASDDQQSIMFFLNGNEIPTPDARGLPIVDDSFVVLLNAAADPVKFTLPDERYGRLWQLVVDTADPTRWGVGHRAAAGDRVGLVAKSVQVLRRMDDARER